ncbi:DUF2291 domain-containing protein [Martelella alba]|uniref:DUF2291 domain-containing protein n=2 Tax=Martelella alba TaxID=2590451 RepID=A0ABY2SIL6_9HYPH|nr:DUF2291 domain-containing protein [Martelella alba]
MSRKILLVLAVLGLGGCRIVSQQELADLKSPPNPLMKNVPKTWQDKMVLQFVHQARPVAELLADLKNAKDFDSACKSLGYRVSDENPCVFFVKVQGQIKNIDTTSRNGKMTVLDQSGETVTVQVGPILRGTLLRDGYKGINYQDFNDQVKFGDYGRAINDQAVKTINAARLKVGETRQIYGVFSSWDTPTQITEITPAQFSQGEGESK